MKFCFPIIALVLLSASTSAQSLVRAYYLIKPVANAPFEPRQGDELNNILSSALAQNSAGTSAKFSNFGIQPTVSILEEGKIEGIKTQMTAKINVNLRMLNLITGDNLASNDLVFVGTGSNRSEALTRAIQQMRQKKAQLEKELANFDQKIRVYYEQNCTALVQKANALMQKNAYADALVLLHGIPADLPCYQQQTSLINQVFAKVQEQNCNAILRKADAAVAGNDFLQALQYLSELDPAAPCAAEASAKIATIETKLDAERQQQWEWLFKFWSAGVNAEVARWNARTAICLEWMHAHSSLNFIDK